MTIEEKVLALEQRVAKLEEQTEWHNKWLVKQDFDIRGLRHGNIQPSIITGNDPPPEVGRSYPSQH